MRMTGLFPYSGNKSRYLNRYHPIPRECNLICEPFAGSAAISISSGRPYLLAEADPGIQDLFNTGRTATLAQWRAQVHEVVSFINSLKVEGSLQIKEELASMRPWQAFIVRVQACGMYVGTACSTVLQQQFVDTLLRRLEVLASEKVHQSLQMCQGCLPDYRDLMGIDSPSTAFVVDPPYLGTHGNYAGGEIRKEDLNDFVMSKEHSPIMVTYGLGAEQIWPDLNWQLVAERKVSRIRSGGSLVRPEHVAYIRWEQDRP